MKVLWKRAGAMALVLFTIISLTSSSVTSRPKSSPMETTLSTSYNTSALVSNNSNSANTTTDMNNISTSLSTNYTTSYSTNYSNTFSTSSSSNYSISHSTSYTTNYSTSYTTNYSTSFTTNYTTSYSTNYSTSSTAKFGNISSFTTYKTAYIPEDSTDYNTSYTTTYSSTNTSLDSIINGTTYHVSINESYSASFGQVSNTTQNATSTNATDQSGVWSWIKNRFLGVLENYSIISTGKSSGGSTVQVTLKQGAITGVKELVPGETERYYYSFKGIPYAEPPVGSLRFMDPVPAAAWNGTRNGTFISPVCPQISLQKVTAMGSEDCLYLNVYTPRPNNSDLPVMVWIHGGNFLIGGANDATPLPLLTKDIVLVTLQYRLGTFGFLSTEDLVLPGNMGLKDQTLALQWVKDNINFLGGNPNNITLFGNCAGAASAHFQILSPKAKGLFSQVIMQSGSALSPWAIRKNHRQVAIAIGQRYNCFDGGQRFDSQRLLQCLQQLPLTDLVSIPYLTQNYQYISLINIMSPRVDGDFLPKHPATLLKEGNYAKVNVMTGVVQHEGAYIALSILSKEAVLNEILDKFEIAGPPLVLVDEEESAVDIAHQIFHFYLGGSRISIESAGAFVDMISDAANKVDHDETVQLLADDAMFGYKTYSYELHYQGQYSFLQFYTPPTKTHWVSHQDELIYLFNKQFTLQRPDDLQIRERIVNLWTNFAATGNPTPNDSLSIQWVPVTPSCFHYLVIDIDPWMQEYDRTRIMEFWRSLRTELNDILHKARGLMNFFNKHKHTAPPPQKCGN